MRNRGLLMIYFYKFVSFARLSLCYSLINVSDEIDEVGSIEIGKKADLVFVDGEFNVKKVMLEGQLQKGI